VRTIFHQVHYRLRHGTPVEGNFGSLAPVFLEPFGEGADLPTESRLRRSDEEGEIGKAGQPLQLDRVAITKSARNGVEKGPKYPG
jgi:hypothetical protein